MSRVWWANGNSRTIIGIMLLALSAIDYAVLALFLLAMLAAGASFAHQQRTTSDFFLARRSLGWFPVGLSVMATAMGAVGFTTIPGDSYYVGLKCLALPLAMWLTLPILIGLVLPLYQRLGITSVYEYLQLRFDARTRLASSGVFIVWRLLWLGGVLYVPAKAATLAAGVSIPQWLLIAILGLVGTIYTYLGGMKAVVWTDAAQAIVMVLGALFVVAGIWWQVEGAGGTIWRIASATDRTQFAELSFSWRDQWCFWGLFPFFFLTMLTYYVADQVTVQRFLAAKDVTDARRSFMLNGAVFTVLVSLLTYAGMALFAFYQLNPQSMRPIWVANVDNRTQQSITDPPTRTEPLLDPETGEPVSNLLGEENPLDPTSGAPLLDYNADGPLLDHDQVNRPRVNQYVAAGKILRPNSKEPFESSDAIFDDETEQLKIKSLAMVKNRPEDIEGVPDEIILHANAKDELLPRFLTGHLMFGIAGIVLVALLAAAMSTMDSGLSSITTLLVIDINREMGVGRKWLARRVGKSVDGLTEKDEMNLARPLTLVVGGGATLLGVAISQTGGFFDVAIKLFGTVGGPLLAVFLLGLFTRRTTAAGAFAALILGTPLTVWLTFGHDLAHAVPTLAWLWPLPQLAVTWPLVFGVLGSLAIGYLVSFVFGASRSRKELRGLVAGIGEPGETDVLKDGEPTPDFDFG
jgi:Na+/proline symporter